MPNICPKDIYLSSNMTSLEPLQVRVVHRVAFEGFRVTQVAVKLQEGQVVLVEVSNGHRKIIMAEREVFRYKHYLFSPTIFNEILYEAEVFLTEVKSRH